MKVIVPYIPGGLGVGVAERLLNLGWSPRFVDVSGSDSAYWELLADLWAAKVDFCVVEQDIVVNADTLDSFEKCENQFCAAYYPYMSCGSQYAGLGCVRFRADMLRVHPDVMEIVGTMTAAGHPPKHWCVNDHLIQQVLQAKGVPRCTNHGFVEHRIGPPAHGCCDVAAAA